MHDKSEFFSVFVIALALLAGTIAVEVSRHLSHFSELLP